MSNQVGDKAKTQIFQGQTTAPTIIISELQGNKKWSDNETQHIKYAESPKHEHITRSSLISVR